MIDKFIYGFIDRVYGAEEYTQQEINAKLIQKMEEVIENCNNAFEFMDWVKDQGVLEEVQNTLNAMVEDGTLEKLINKELNDIVKELRTEINNLNTFKDEVNTKLNELNSFKDEVNTKLVTINTEIENIKNRLNSSQATSNTV